MIKLKVFAKFPNDKDFKLWGYEWLNVDGDWTYRRTHRSDHCLGTISDNQGNAKFRRMRFTGLHDGAANEIYEGAELTTGETVIFENGSFRTTYKGDTQSGCILTQKRCKYLYLKESIS